MTRPSTARGLLGSADRTHGSIVSEPGQNAISTLLSPPLLRTGVIPHPALQPSLQKPPSSQDIPPVALTAIPHVEMSAFQDYLNLVGSLIDTIQRGRLETEDGGSRVLRKDFCHAEDDQFARLNEHGEKKDAGGSVSNRPTSIPKPNQLAPTPLSTIPAVYFDENLRLENPRTFDVVSEYAEIVRQPQSTRDSIKAANGINNDKPQLDRKALSTNAILQEKLSWYMDIVEINLITSISKASGSFFTALASFHELRSDAAASVVKIQKLREDLTDLDNDIVAKGLQIIDLKQKRNNLHKLGQSLEQLQCVLNGTSHCKELVDSGELEMAMLHISSVEQLAAGTLDLRINDDLDWLLPNPSMKLTDLSRLHALSSLPESFAQLRLRIGKGYEDRLRSVLICDLRQHVSSAQPRNTLARWMNAARRARGMTSGSLSMPGHIMNIEKLRGELVPILEGLEKSQYLAPASITLPEAVIRTLKSIIRQHLPASTDDDNESIASTSTQASNRRLTQSEKSSILSRNLRALGPREAEAFFVNVYCEIDEALRRLGVQVKILLDITSNMDKALDSTFTPRQSPGRLNGPSVHSPDHSIKHDSPKDISQAFDVSSLLEVAAEECQSEIMKVLRVRTEQTVNLPLADFLRYFMLNRLFVNECEAVSGHFGAPLQGVVDKQIRDFITVMHELEMQKLATKMESEKWERISFTTDGAVTVANITQSMTADPTAWLDYTDVSVASLGAGEMALQKKEKPSTPDIEQDKKTLTLAVINEEKFSLNGSAVFALRGIEQYTILLASVPSMANDISRALIDYLKLYNSRTQQLILGAGAKRTAGLANINTKHLALALQSLSFFIALIPCLRECVRRRPSITRTNMAEYDRLQRLLQEHQTAIYDKLIDIMKLRATLCIRAIEKTRWDDEDEVQRGVSPHVETLAKETLTLRRVLDKYLPESSVRMIIGPVFVIYHELWSKAFEHAQVWTKEGQARLLRDAEFLEAKLGKIQGTEDFGAHIVSVVKAKQIVP